MATLADNYIADTADQMEAAMRYHVEHAEYATAMDIPAIADQDYDIALDRAVEAGARRRSLTDWDAGLARLKAGRI